MTETAPPDQDKPKLGWGGKRKGAGRPRKDGTRPKHPGVPHLPRTEMPEPLPVRVKWKSTKDVWSLQSSRFLEIWASAMIWAEQLDFRVIHYAFEEKRIHLIVEASSNVALARGMKGLGVRIARAVNGLMNRHGQVLADRYAATVLTDRAMVRDAREELFAKGADKTPVSAPQTALLRQ